MCQERHQCITEAVLEDDQRSAVVGIGSYLSDLFIFAQYCRVAVNALSKIKEQAALFTVCKIGIVVLCSIIVIGLIVDESIGICFQFAVIVAETVHRTQEAVYLALLVGLEVGILNACLIGKYLACVVSTKGLPVVVCT